MSLYQFNKGDTISFSDGTKITEGHLMFSFIVGSSAMFCLIESKIRESKRNYISTNLKSLKNKSVLLTEKYLNYRK